MDDRDWEHCGSRSCMTSCGCTCKECRRTVLSIAESTKPEGGKITIREACRQRMALDGTDAQALEHGMTQLEAENKKIRAMYDREAQRLEKESLLAKGYLAALEEEKAVSEARKTMADNFAMQLHDSEAKRELGAAKRKGLELQNSALRKVIERAVFSARSAVNLFEHSEDCPRHSYQEGEEDDAGTPFPAPSCDCSTGEVEKVLDILLEAPPGDIEKRFCECLKDGPTTEVLKGVCLRCGLPFGSLRREHVSSVKPFSNECRAGKHRSCEQSMEYCGCICHERLT